MLRSSRFGNANKTCSKVWILEAINNSRHFEDDFVSLRRSPLAETEGENPFSNFHKPSPSSFVPCNRHRCDISFLFSFLSSSRLSINQLAPTDFINIWRPSRRGVGPRSCNADIAVWTRVEEKRRKASVRQTAAAAAAAAAAVEYPRNTLTLSGPGLN